MRGLVGMGLATLVLVSAPGQAKDDAASKDAAASKNDAVTIGPAPKWVRLADPMPVPDAPRGPAFVRLNDVEIHLDNAGEWLFTSSRVKILDSSALQIGNIAIAWNPAAGTPVVHGIRVYRDGAVRDVLTAAKFEILRRESQLEAATLDGILTAALRIPDLRVGDELEVSYSLPIHDPTLRDSKYGFLVLGEAPPPGRMTLRLSWEPGLEPTLQPSKDFASVLQRSALDASVSFDNPAVQSMPKDAPPRFAFQRILTYSNFPDWAALSRQVEPLFAAASALSATSPVRKEAEAIAAAHADPMERAAAALKLVQQQVRYVYVGLNGGNLTPASADETWQRRYGDCKAKTALLLSLLRELGVDAEAVLVSANGNDDGIDTRLPNPSYFDHVLVRAKIGGKVYWLDGTLPPVAGPSEDPVYALRWVLRLSLTGTGLERVTWKPLAQPANTYLYDIDARAGFDAPIKKRVVSITRGLDGLKEYVIYSSVGDAQLEAKVKQEYEGGEDWTTVDKVTWHYDTAARASVLEISGTGAADWNNDGGGAHSMSLPGGGFYPPTRRQRAGVQDTSIPYYIEPTFDCHVTTVRLPSSTAEKDWSFNSTFTRLLFGQTIYRAMERRSGSIRMVRAKRTVQTEIDVAAAAKDNAEIAGFDNSQAQIYYNPHSYDRPRKTQTVPTVDEIDWVANPGACLAPALPAK